MSIHKYFPFDYPSFIQSISAVISDAIRTMIYFAGAARGDL
jgi:hypothetical protein